MDETEPDAPPVQITHLRDSLGFFYQLVADTDRPIVIQRYRDQSVAMVPLWEWQWLKQLEAKVRAGEPVIPEED